jgi:Uma2 family endonuclease
MPLPKTDNQKYTYKDYPTWPDDQRWEIINGVAYAMTAPAWQHQQISSELHIQFGAYLKDKNCQVFASPLSPFDLRLPETSESNEDSTTNIQPDLVIICDRSKLKGTGYTGAPPS